MTKAVKREPGDILVVTRRCHLQWARFVPEEQVRAAFHVILDAAERRTGVRVVAFMAMSNHYHAVVEDVDCRFGRWASEVNAQLATFANVVQGLGSHAWRRASVLGLGEPGDRVGVLAVVVAGCDDAHRGHRDGAGPFVRAPEGLLP